jgi:hypothetical protein
MWLPLDSFKPDRAWKAGWYYLDGGKAVGAFVSPEIATFFARKAGYVVSHVIDRTRGAEFPNSK